MSTIAIGRGKSNQTLAWLTARMQMTAGLLLAVVVLSTLWWASALPVHVTVDGVSETVRTHRRDVGALLIDLGLVLHEADRVTPERGTRLTAGMQVRVDRARPVRIWSDGRTLEGATWGTTVQEVLWDVGILVDPYDKVYVDGVQMDLDAPLGAAAIVQEQFTYGRDYAWATRAKQPITLEVVRAVPIEVYDGGLPYTIRTTAHTIGEALREAEITMYLGDRVDPSLGTAVSSGLRVTIQRSLPASVTVDGATYKTRTRAKTVGEALTEMQVGLAGLDRVNLPLDTPVYEDMSIEIVRVREDVEIEEEIAPFETVYVPDATLEIDTQSVVNPGAEGITRSRYRVWYEDGVETARVFEDRWVAQEPEQRVIAYGQLIEPKTFVAADGTQLTYWRRIRMLASSYSAGTAGVSPSASNYGRTYTGDVMRHGIVAVDPRVIPLRSRVYVPGYGTGEALDTGSAILARRIDLGYDDSNLQLWNRWVDVYLLWPPPSRDQITWVLPNWPLPPN